MRVSHFNTFPYGGAANAALRLHNEMLEQGLESEFLFGESDRDNVAIQNGRKIELKTTRTRPRNVVSRFLERRRTKKIYRMFDQHLAARDENLEVFSMADLVEPTQLPDEFWLSDRHAGPISHVLHLHWIAFLADYPSFFGAISNATPIVWTLHDMNPLTGGCHYSNGCLQFRSGCGNCTQVVNPSANDVSAFGFDTKRKALRQKNLTIVTPSLWLGELAKSSPIFPTGTRFEHIKLGFDLNEFSPMEKQAARAKLNLDPDVILVGFGAESVNNRRKGMDLLLTALESLPNVNGDDNGNRSGKKIECMVFGSGKIAQQDRDLPKIHELGFLSNSESLRTFYSACDLVVVPSREDNQPQVGLEAMACGTPVVGFNVGGISEYVQDGTTGRLAVAESHEDLAKQVSELASDDQGRLQMSSNCRNMMLREHDIVAQTKSYTELYRQLTMGQISNVA